MSLFGTWCNSSTISLDEQTHNAPTYYNSAREGRNCKTGNYVQKKHLVDGEVYTQTKQNMDYLSINDEVLLENSDKLKNTLKKNIEMKAFEFLIQKAQSHSKVNDRI